MKKKFLSILLAATMVAAALTGCGQEDKTSDEGNTPAASDEAEDGEVAYEDLPTINVLFIHGYANEGEDNEIWKEVAKKVGAKIHFIGADTDKYNTMIASGEGYDILIAEQKNMATFATGGTLLALDDLVASNGENISANLPKFLEYSKETFSDGTDSLYWLPTANAFTGQKVGDKDSAHALIRWDLYKEMGYPEVNSVDEYLQMLADMMEANPTNEAGEKVYGMSIPSDVLTNTMINPFLAWNGKTNFQKTASYSWKDMSYSNIYGEDGVFWDGVEFYHKAYQLGLLDPDSFTLTEADMKAKASAGRLLYVSFSWQYDPMTDGKGFESIPLSFASPQPVINNPASELSFYFGMAINKNTEYPELCMDYMNFLASEEGANLINNGIEGVHYTVENGVRTLTDEALAMYNDGTWDANGLGSGEIGNLTILHQMGILSDGKPVLLTKDSDLFASTLTDVQKDFCEHYGVDYPTQAFMQMAEKNNLPTREEMDPTVQMFLPIPTDDIAQLEAAVVSEAEGLVAGLVMADDSEFEAKLEAAKAQLAKVGVTKIDEFYNANWQTAFEKAAQWK